MAQKFNPEININPASLVLVGEITHVLRAQGKPLCPSIDVEGPDFCIPSGNPIIGGITGYREIPQAQVGFMTYHAFEDQANRFHMPEMEERKDRHPWNMVGAVSLDAIFTPYTNHYESGRAGPYLPNWTYPQDSNTVNSRKLNPFDPFNLLDEATLKSAPEPVFVSGVSGEWSMSGVGLGTWHSSGHNIAMALNYNMLDSGVDGKRGTVGVSGKYPGEHNAPVDFYFEKDHWARHRVETTGLRSVGFKAPMILTGWGYDTDGNPVPTGAGGGIHPRAPYDPKLWKSGPVDLRWDEARGVWTGGQGTSVSPTKIYLVKMTNLYTPPSFSFEVDRSNTRDQFTRNAPNVRRNFSAEQAIYDPEYLAYVANSDNKNHYELLEYDSIEFPFYEAFIIRETADNPPASVNYYNLFSEDCQDCGHVSNPCATHHGSSNTAYKKILVENPLRQSFDVGDLAFTVYTGRKKQVNTGHFTGGSGAGGQATLVVDSSGIASVQIDSAGADYTYGAFALQPTGCNVCASVSLETLAGQLHRGSVSPSGGHLANENCTLTIIPNNATIQTEEYEIHWVTQAEFKSQQLVTHVECDNGILQSCSIKLQTQGYKTCEWCGEDTALINS